MFSTIIAVNAMPDIMAWKNLGVRISILGRPCNYEGLMKCSCGEDWTDENSKQDVLLARINDSLAIIISEENFCDR